MIFKVVKNKVFFFMIGDHKKKTTFFVILFEVFSYNSSVLIALLPHVSFLYIRKPECEFCLSERFVYRRPPRVPSC